MDKMFPEARKTLQDADPEVYKLVQDEKKRQWCDAGTAFQMSCRWRCACALASNIQHIS